MEYIKHHCLFLLNRKSADDDTHYLKCRVKWDCCRSAVSFNLGFVIDPEKWDSKVQLCVPKSFHGKRRIPANVINAEIRRYSDAADKVFASLSKIDSEPSADAVRTALRVELGLEEKKVMSVIQAYQIFYMEQSVQANWSDGTCKKMKTMMGHIESFEQFPTFDCFDELHLTRFVQYLREDARLSDTTIKKYIALLKWFLKWAEKKKYLDNRDYSFFNPKIRTAPKPVIFLSWEELMRVWEWSGHTEEYGAVRDMFCFCATTSLRYSDAQNLRWSDVYDDHIEVVTVKTSDALIIDLNKWSRSIIEKYANKLTSNANKLTEKLTDYVFPRMPNQVMNRYLKEICRECGIDEPIRVTTFSGSKRKDTTYRKYELIGTHAARRTFICQALMLGIAPNVVMKWTGHSDYDAMRPYIAITDAAKKSAMKLFDNL